MEISQLIRKLQTLLIDVGAFVLFLSLILRLTRVEWDQHWRHYFRIRTRRNRRRD